jgi:hypothetical protein
VRRRAHAPGKHVNVRIVAAVGAGLSQAALMRRNLRRQHRRGNDPGKYQQQGSGY